MSKEIYIVNCYTCQHNGQETCKGCNTLLNEDIEPYENWELREDLSQKDKRIAELEQELAELKEKAIVPQFKYKDYVYAIYSDKDIFRGQIDIFDYYTKEYLVFFNEDIGNDWFSENSLFATEQEAQEKLKETQGNE